MPLSQDEAVAMAAIAICGIGCSPVQDAKRRKVQECLEALWVAGYNNGYRDGHVAGDTGFDVEPPRD